MLQVCPIQIIEQDRCVPARVVPVRRDCIVISAIYSKDHMEQVETLGDVLDRLNVVDGYRLDRDALVIWMQPETNMFCGGEVEFSVGYAKTSVGRWESYQNNKVYISRERDGTLCTAIAA